MALPQWATKVNNDTYLINADEAFPALLDELRVNPVDQYWLEVVYQFAKLDLRRALLLEGKSAWPNKIMVRGDKSRWAQRYYPAGRGPEKATKGKEARQLYKKLRGFVPN